MTKRQKVKVTLLIRLQRYRKIMSLIFRVLFIKLLLQKC